MQHIFETATFVDGNFTYKYDKLYINLHKKDKIRLHTLLILIAGIISWWEYSSRKIAFTVRDYVHSYGL